MFILNFYYYEKQKLTNYIKNFIKQFYFIFFRFFYFFFWFFSILNIFSYSFNKEKTFRVKLFYFLSLFFFKAVKRSFWKYSFSSYYFHRFFFKYFSFFFIKKMKKSSFFVQKYNSIFKIILFSFFYFPKKSSLISVLRSPFIYKKSFEQFGIYWYKTKFNFSYVVPAKLNSFFFNKWKQVLFELTPAARPVIIIKKNNNKIFNLKWIKRVKPNL